MMNCNTATSLISQKRERELTFSERMKLRLHVAMCSGCRNFELQVPALSQAAKAYARLPDKDEV